MKKILAIIAAMVIISATGFSQTGQPMSDTSQHKTMKKKMKKPMKKRMDSTSMMDSSSTKPMK